jgi:hypothetical protein
MAIPVKIVVFWYVTHWSVVQPAGSMFIVERTSTFEMKAMGSLKILITFYQS